jgi:hypothetical protein|tara:strand:- start:1506 stop:1760 length:255 start_codon:yes stop_codon:yes gene_type:complete
MIGKRKTSQFKTEIEATVRISVDHNQTFTEQQLLDEFSTNVSEDFHQVMSSDSQHLQPTQVTVMSEKVIKSNGIDVELDVVDSK